MTLTIRDKADAVATFRHVSVNLMETLARWVPLTPEMEVKTLFGRHIWDLAQHADQLGKRTVELRAALHYTRPPVAAYETGLSLLRAASSTAQRIGAVYDVALPDLERRYRAYRDQVDPLLDEPTVRILDRILSDLARMASQREEVRAERKDLQPADSRWLAQLQSTFASVDDWVDFRPPQATAMEVL